MPSYDMNFFINDCKEIGIELTDSQVEAFYKYFSMLVDANKNINLTAITEFNEVCTKHFIDSLCFVKLFDNFNNMKESLFEKTLADIGTGAGFPGIPLKILLPELKITLIDSLEKRINFLNNVINELGLQNINTVHGRVEDLAGEDRFREQFDYCVARAVAGLPVLCEYCLPFVAKSGYFVAFKSEKAGEELSISKNALNILGGQVEKSVEFILPSSNLMRTLISVKKVENTPSKYPRRAGVPVKKPLL